MAVLHQHVRVCMPVPVQREEGDGAVSCARQLAWRPGLHRAGATHVCGIHTCSVWPSGGGQQAHPAAARNLGGVIERVRGWSSSAGLMVHPSGVVCPMHAFRLMASGGSCACWAWHCSVLPSWTAQICILGHMHFLGTAKLLKQTPAASVC